MSFSFRAAAKGLVTVLGSLLAIVCAGCGGELAQGTFVGSVKGSDAKVALVAEEGAFVGYVCGGPSTFATHSRWFSEVASGHGDFTARQGGWTLKGTIGSALGGTLTAPDGTVLEIEAERVPDKGLDGLYEAMDSGCRTGVIAWTGESGEAALQGTWCDDKDHFEQVTPVLPIERTEAGLHVTVDVTKLGLTVRDLHVQPVVVPVR